MITTAYLKQLIQEHPINFKRLCDDANVSLNSVYQKIFYKNRALKPYEEERLREGLIIMRKYLEEGTMSKIEIDAEKIKAELAYEQAKKTIEEIKVIQKEIEKLLAEIRELALGYNPNKIIERKQNGQISRCEYRNQRNNKGQEGLLDNTCGIRY